MKNFGIMIVAATVLLATHPAPVVAQTGSGGASILSLAPWAGSATNSGFLVSPLFDQLFTNPPAPGTGTMNNSGFLVAPLFDQLFTNPPAPGTGSMNNSGFLVAPMFDRLFLK
jgi:hypothetical protein